MDNQKIGRSGKVDARQLTKEIDQATNPIDIASEDLQMAAGAEQLRTAQARIGQLGIERPSEDGMNSPVLNDLGRGGLRVIEVGQKPNVVPTGANERVILSTRDVQQNETLTGAAQELSRDTAEITHAEDFVGLETRLQRREHEREDRYDAQLEDGIGPKREVEIARQSQEQRGERMGKMVTDVLKQKNFRIKELYDLFRGQRGEMMQDFETPRKIGDRN